MTHLELASTMTCTLCARRLAGIMLGNYRINRHSLRPTRPSLRFVEDPCRECGWPNGRTGIETWVLTPESRRAVAVARSRKGWAA